MSVLVTGGAGYIGSHVVKLLQSRGERVVVVDDLVSGVAGRVDADIITLDLADADARPALEKVIHDYGVDSVIHFAARKKVGESVERPDWYHAQNVGGMTHLLRAMESQNVRRIVFSSSAAVYGEVDGAIDESHPVRPINPYGSTKLLGEQLLAAAAYEWGLSATSLRYFNVGGAGQPELGDTQIQNLIPIVFDALDSGRRPVIFGDSYPTPDGTCIRDYVHVVDVADAHVAVLDHLGPPVHSIYNIGTGVGTSVREMVDRITATVGRDVDPIVEAPRAGDPATVVAVTESIRSAVGWHAQLGLEAIIESAWKSRNYFKSLHWS